MYLLLPLAGMNEADSPINGLLHELSVMALGNTCRFMQITYKFHIKIASCAPPHLLERILEALYYLSQKDTPGRRDERVCKHVEGARGSRARLCALRWGEGREASEDSLNTAVQSEMRGWSKINFEIPGSEGLHAISASTRQPRTHLPLLQNHTRGHGRRKRSTGSLSWFERAHQL